MEELLSEIDRSGKWQLVRITYYKFGKKEEVINDDLDYDNGVRILRGAATEAPAGVYYLLHKKDFVKPCLM